MSEKAIKEINSSESEERTYGGGDNKGKPNETVKPPKEVTVNPDKPKEK